jgi:hypothetical protein
MKQAHALTAFGPIGQSGADADVTNDVLCGWRAASVICGWKRSSLSASDRINVHFQFI